MGYWKFTNAEALAAWEKTRADEAQMRKEAAELTSLIGGKPVFKSDITRSTFYGVNFDAAPYLAKELWTVPTGSTGYASWPKARPPKGLKEEHAAVKKLWSDNYPKTKVDNDELYEAIGLDWGMLVLCGLTLFRHGDAIYIQTSATPKDGFGAVEIVGSEFDKARRDYSDAKA